VARTNPMSWSVVDLDQLGVVRSAGRPEKHRRSSDQHFLD
jgi:hypothetical protein